MSCEEIEKQEGRRQIEILPIQKVQTTRMTADEIVEYGRKRSADDGHRRCDLEYMLLKQTQEKEQPQSTQEKEPERKKIELLPVPKVPNVTEGRFKKYMCQIVEYNYTFPDFLLLDLNGMSSNETEFLQSLHAGKFARDLYILSFSDSNDIASSLEDYWNECHQNTGSLKEKVEKKGDDIQIEYLNKLINQFALENEKTFEEQCRENPVIRYRKEKQSFLFDMSKMNSEEIAFLKDETVRPSFTYAQFENNMILVRMDKHDTELESFLMDEPYKPHCNLSEEEWKRQMQIFVSIADKAAYFILIDY